MLNLDLGSPQTVEGRSCICTKMGSFGHALYGPYEQLGPGSYVAGFGIAAAGGFKPKPKTVLAVIDISSNGGKDLLARQEVIASDLASGPRSFSVPFDVADPSRVEYRVWVSGKASLLIDDNRPAVAVPDEGMSDDVVAQTRFPIEAGRAVPFFNLYRAELQALFDRGIGVQVVDGSVRLIVGSIVVHAACEDDLRFIGELFLENAYNFLSPRPACVIDIGMNIGLASLHFATKPEVREIHSFEPFAQTYDRATANLMLNPALAAKITPHRSGLSDADYDGPILISDHGNSGAMTTIGVEGGIAVNLSLRDAGATLSPIIEDAISRGLEVILKIDCEGSEFAIFESIRRKNLLGKIRAFLVEWHALFDGKTQNTLIAPLREAGYLVFDRSPPIGNGFFYAARLD